MTTEKKTIFFRWRRKIAARLRQKKGWLYLLGVVALLLLLNLAHTSLIRAHLQRRALPGAAMIGSPSRKRAVVARPTPSPSPTRQVRKPLLLPAVYGVVGAYREKRIDIHIGDLHAYWQGQPSRPAALFYKKIYLLPGVREDLRRLWHEEASQRFVMTLPNAQMLLATVREDPESIGILPLDQVRVGVQLFTVDGYDPVRPRTADFAGYPLAIYHQADVKGKFTASVDKLSWVTLSGDAVLWPELAQEMADQRVSATALVERIQGAELFSGADGGLVILHNTLPFRSSFRSDRKQPDGSLRRFAAPLIYTRTLQALQPAAVDMGGGHIMDYGPGGLLFTLQQYQALHWRPFGVVVPDGTSGALQAVQLTQRENRVAFIGIDAASSSQAGRFPNTFAHDFRLDWPQLAQQIAQWRSETVPPLIFVLVHGPAQENPVAGSAQMKLFRQIMAQGADVVVGVQGDVPQNAALSADGRRIIFYGLGHFWARPEADQEKDDRSLWRRSWVVQFFLYDHHLIAFRLHSAVQDPKTGYVSWAKDDTSLTAENVGYAGEDQPGMSALWSAFVRALVSSASR